MSNVLHESKQQQVIALGRLGWSLRRIEATTGVRRETVSAYLKAADIAVRRRGGRTSAWPPANPATTATVSTDSVGDGPPVSPAVSVDPPPGRAPTASACEPYRELILEGLRRGRIRQLLDLLTVLAKTRLPDAGVVERVLGVVKQLHKFEAQRNTLIHSLWSVHTSEPEKVVRSKVNKSRPKGLVRIVQTPTSSEIRALTQSIEEFHKLFSGDLWDIARAFPRTLEPLTALPGDTESSYRSLWEYEEWLRMEEAYEDRPDAE